MEIIKADPYVGSSSVTDADGNVVKKNIMKWRYVAKDENVQSDQGIMTAILDSVAMYDKINYIVIKEENDDSYWSPTKEWVCESADEIPEKVKELRNQNYKLQCVDIYGEVEGKRLEGSYLLKKPLWFIVSSSDGDFDAERLYGIKGK